MDGVKNYLQLLGRVIVGAFLLFNAFNHFANLGMIAGYAASKGVPLPSLAVLGSGLLLAFAGLSLLLGYRIDIGIAALALFLLPVTLMMHDFWNVEGQARVAEMVNFLKNFAILGSSLVWLAAPSPLPLSLESWLAARGRSKIVTRPIEQN
jgi:putative oxidoreductase